MQSGGPSPKKQRHSPPLSRPPAFPLPTPTPLLRTQAKRRGCSSDPWCASPAPAQSSGSAAGSLGQPGPAQRGVMFQPDLAGSTHHGVCDRSLRGSPHAEARPKGPGWRLQQRQRNRTAAAAQSWKRRSSLGPP